MDLDLAPTIGEAWIPRKAWYVLIGIVIGEVMMVLSGAMVVAGISAPQRLIGWFGVVFFTTAVASGIWRARRGEKTGVALNVSGFVEVRGDKKYAHNWNEVVSFRLIEVSQITQVVGYTLKDQSHLDGLEKVLHERYGVDGVLMRALSVEGPVLENVMNLWRSTYCTRRDEREMAH